jgi:chromosome segregation ATPase
VLGVHAELWLLIQSCSRVTASNSTFNMSNDIMSFAYVKIIQVEVDDLRAQLAAKEQQLAAAAAAVAAVDAEISTLAAGFAAEEAAVAAVSADLAAMEEAASAATAAAAAAAAAATAAAEAMETQQQQLQQEVRLGGWSVNVC